MLTIATIILVVAVLYFLKLQRDGTIPAASGPKGLPSRIIAIVLAVALFSIYVHDTIQGGLNQSNIVLTVGAIGAAAWAIMKAKRRQEQRQAGIEAKGEMKRSLMFLGFAILIAVILGILYPYIHR